VLFRALFVRARARFLPLAVPPRIAIEYMSPKKEAKKSNERKNTKQPAQNHPTQNKMNKTNHQFDARNAMQV
jgi:hypothetical protein